MTTSPIIWIAILFQAILFVLCAFQGYRLLFKTEKIVDHHLKNRDKWWMKGLPSKMYKRENYKSFMLMFATLFLLLAISIAISIVKNIISILK